MSCEIVAYIVNSAILILLVGLLMFRWLGVSFENLSYDIWLL